MTNNNIKTLLDEVKNIIEELKSNTSLTGQTKTDLEKRINHILDKSNPRHTNLTQDLETDLKELTELEKTLGEEKIKQTQEKKKLEDENKQLKEDNQTKQTLIEQKDKEIGQKITADFITKLENLTKDGVKLDETKINEIKTAVEEMKSKGVKGDMTDTNNKIEEVKGVVKEIKPTGTNYWSIGACVIGGLILVAVLFSIFTRKVGSKSYLSKEDLEE